MAKFNKPSVGTKTTNLAGGTAYKESSPLALISILLTSFVNEQYYRTAEAGISDLANALRDTNKKLAAQAALYARHVFGMRSITHVMASLLAPYISKEPWAKSFYEKIIHRVDDITEILSFHLGRKQKLSAAMKKGLAKAFDKFDGYQLAKYRGEGKEMKLVDAVNLLHPKPTEKNKEALESLIKGILVSTDTWESELTRAGQNASTEDEKIENKKEVWVKLIKEKKIGYFALLRNLRNIMEQAPEVLADACVMLMDPRLIEKSLVFPFRYISAFTAINKTDKLGRNVYSALSTALDLSLKNVPIFHGETLVVIDHSGSMGNGYSSNFMKGAIFGIVLAKTNNADLMHFGHRAEYLKYNLLDPTILMAEKLDSLNQGWYGDTGYGSVGHATNFPAIFQIANKKYDRIIIFSDMQGWVGGGAPTSAVIAYKIKYDANPFIYSIDLSGYGTLMFPENHVICLAGFSDKIFSLMKYCEEDKNAMIHEIEKIEL